MNLGVTELLLIGVIALLLFGPSKLPKLGRSLGESIRGFKKALNEDEPSPREVNQQIAQNKQKPLNQNHSNSEEKSQQKDSKQS
ncbi:MAG: Sec-independent protein translocase subunit TatA/TatB [Bdellovibrio sp.]